MGSVTSPTCLEPSRALRLRSADALRSSLNQYVVASEPVVEVDFRDVLVGLAPFYDCAQRLGIDPVALFDEASRDLGVEARELIQTFGRRSDITLEAFGLILTSTDAGPCYRPDSGGLGR